MDETARSARSTALVTTARGCAGGRLLARGRPLGASRVLWEIGSGKNDLRSLRARLGSRRGLSDAAGAVAGGRRAGRRRAGGGGPARAPVRLTDAGRAERAELDRASDALAALVPRPVERAPARAAGGGDGRGRAPPDAGLVAVAVEPPGNARGAALPASATSGRSTSASSPASTARWSSRSARTRWRRRTACCCSRGCRRADRLRRAVAARRRDRRRQADVGRARGARARRRAAPPGRARAPRPRRGPVLPAPGHQPRAGRGDLAYYRAAGFAEVPAYNDEPYAHHWFAKELHALGR